MTQLSDLIAALGHYANGMELAQTITAMIGVSFSVWALFDAVKDSMALTMSGANGPRRVIATGNIYTELERLAVQSVLFIVGLISIFVPPPFWPDLPVPQGELLQHTMTRIGLILITVIKLFSAIRTRRERGMFVRKMTAFGYNPKTPAVALAPPPGITEPVHPCDDPRRLRKDESTVPRYDESIRSADNSSE